MRKRQYAAATGVNSEQSRAEIERTLTRYGAEQFAYGWDREMATVGFALSGRKVRFVLPMPDRNDPEFVTTPRRGKSRSQEAAGKSYDQAVRQKWRALALVVKAKLEAVESGITTFDEEFLAHIVLPGGHTIGEMALPQIEAAYASGRPIALITDGRD